jgi:hypothetical protein
MTERRVVFATHDYYAACDEPDYRRMPIIGFGFKMQTEDAEGRREEVTGDHIIMCGYLFFRPRKTGFILCLN